MSSALGEVPSATPSRQEISDWIVSYLSQTLDIPAANIDRGRDLEQLGLNSALVVSMIGDLEEWLGVELTPSLVFDYPNIDAIAGHLAGEAVR
jgi:acyl carrier protein